MGNTPNNNPTNSQSSPNKQNNLTKQDIDNLVKRVNQSNTNNPKKNNSKNNSINNSLNRSCTEQADDDYLQLEILKNFGTQYSQYKDSSIKPVQNDDNYNFFTGNFCIDDQSESVDNIRMDIYEDNLKIEGLSSKMGKKTVINNNSTPPVIKSKLRKKVIDKIQKEESDSSDEIVSNDNSYHSIGHEDDKNNNIKLNYVDKCPISFEQREHFENEFRISEENQIHQGEQFEGVKKDEQIKCDFGDDEDDDEEIAERINSHQKLIDNDVIMSPRQDSHINMDMIPRIKEIVTFNNNSNQYKSEQLLTPTFNDQGNYIEETKNIQREYINHKEIKTGEIPSISKTKFKAIFDVKEEKGNYPNVFKSTDSEKVLTKEELKKKFKKKTNKEMLSKKMEKELSEIESHSKIKDEQEDEKDNNISNNFEFPNEQSNQKYSKKGSKIFNKVDKISDNKDLFNKISERFKTEIDDNMRTSCAEEKIYQFNERCITIYSHFKRSNNKQSNKKKNKSFIKAIDPQRLLTNGTNNINNSYEEMNTGGMLSRIENISNIEQSLSESEENMNKSSFEKGIIDKLKYRMDIFTDENENSANINKEENKEEDINQMNNLYQREQNQKLENNNIQSNLNINNAQYFSMKNHLIQKEISDSEFSSEHDDDNFNIENNMNNSNNQITVNDEGPNKIFLHNNFSSDNDEISKQKNVSTNNYQNYTDDNYFDTSNNEKKTIDKEKDASSNNKSVKSVLNKKKENNNSICDVEIKEEKDKNNNNLVEFNINNKNPNETNSFECEENNSQTLKQNLKTIENYKYNEAPIILEEQKFSNKNKEEKENDENNLRGSSPKGEEEIKSEEMNNNGEENKNEESEEIKELNFNSGELKNVIQKYIDTKSSEEISSFNKSNLRYSKDIKSTPNNKTKEEEDNKNTNTNTNINLLNLETNKLSTIIPQQQLTEENEDELLIPNTNINQNILIEEDERKNSNPNNIMENNISLEIKTEQENENVDERELFNPIPPLTTIKYPEEEYNFTEENNQIFPTKKNYIEEEVKSVPNYTKILNNSKKKKRPCQKLILCHEGIENIVPMNSLGSNKEKTNLNKNFELLIERLNDNSIYYESSTHNPMTPKGNFADLEFQNSQSICILSNKQRTACNSSNNIIQHVQQQHPQNISLGLPNINNNINNQNHINIQSSPKSNNNNLFYESENNFQSNMCYDSNSAYQIQSNPNRQYLTEIDIPLNMVETSIPSRTNNNFSTSNFDYEIIGKNNCLGRRRNYAENVQSLNIKQQKNQNIFGQNIKGYRSPNKGKKKFKKKRKSDVTSTKINYAAFKGLIFYSYLQKVIDGNIEVGFNPKLYYSNRFCVLSEDKFICYSSKESFILLEKPLFLLHISQILKCQKISRRANEKTRHIKNNHIVIIYGGIYNNISRIEDYDVIMEQQHSFDENNCASVIFLAETDTLVKAWISVINQAISKYKELNTEN